MGMGMGMMEQLLRELPYALPMLLAYGAGVAVGLFHLKRHPMPSMLTMAACGSLFLMTVLSRVHVAWITTEMSNGAMPVDEMQAWFMLSRVVSMIIDLIAFVLLLVAVYVGRRAVSSGASSTHDRSAPA